MKKVILHIGLHKTGSSSIQESLYQNRLTLREKGFHYFCEDFDGIDRALPRKWIDSSNFKRVFIKEPKLLHKKIKETDRETVIISIEDFSWFLKDEDFDTVLEAFQGFDITIFFYIRRQDKQLISYMQEGSKSKHKPSIRYYGKTHTSLPKEYEKSYLNYYKRYLLWDNKFPGRVNVKSFEDGCDKFGDIVLDFVDTFNLPNIKVVKTNESLGFKKTKVGHILNHLNLDNELESFIRDNLKDSTDKAKPSANDAKKIYDRYRDSNIKLNQLLNGKDECFFNDDFSMYRAGSQDLWTENVANEVICDILKIFNAYINKDRN